MNPDNYSKHYRFLLILSFSINNDNITDLKKWQPNPVAILDKENEYVKIKHSVKAVNVSVDIYFLPERTGHRVEAGLSSDIY